MYKIGVSNAAIIILKTTPLINNPKNLINYLYLAKHIHNNLYYNDTTNERVGFPQVGEMAFTGGYYFTQTKNNIYNRH
mgnify:CR=1 FL=1